MDIIELKKTHNSANSTDLKAPTAPQTNGYHLKLSEIGNTFELGFEYDGKEVDQKGYVYIDIYNEKEKLFTWIGGLKIKTNELEIRGLDSEIMFEDIIKEGMAIFYYVVDIGSVNRKSASLSLKVLR